MRNEYKAEILFSDFASAEKFLKQYNRLGKSFEKIFLRLPFRNKMILFVLILIINSFLLKLFEFISNSELLIIIFLCK